MNDELEHRDDSESAARGRPTERRRATVLFADIAGFTSLRRGLAQSRSRYV